MSEPSLHKKRTHGEVEELLVKLNTEPPQTYEEATHWCELLRNDILHNDNNAFVREYITRNHPHVYLPRNSNANTLWSPLSWAIDSNNVEVFDMYLQARFNPNFPITDDGVIKSPLHYLLQNESKVTNIRFFELLRDNKQTRLEIDYNTEHPLITLFNSIDHMMIKRGFKENPVYKAKLEQLKCLLTFPGFIVDPEHKYSARDSTRFIQPSTALRSMITYDTLNILLDNGFDPNTLYTSRGKRIPGHPDCVYPMLYFLFNNADWKEDGSFRNEDKVIPLIDLLIEKGADVDYLLHLSTPIMETPIQVGYVDGPINRSESFTTKLRRWLRKHLEDNKLKNKRNNERYAFTAIKSFRKPGLPKDIMAIIRGFDGELEKPLGKQKQKTLSKRGGRQRQFRRIRPSTKKRKSGMNT